MDSTSPPRPDGPRYATLMDQMQAWLIEQLTKNQPASTLERRVPPQQ